MRSDALVATPDSQCSDSVTALVPGGTTRLAHLSNEDLLTETRYLVGKSNQILAALLEHLAEVEARGLHRTRACASLYTYCIYELRFSEDAAFRRASAARWVRRFPVLLAAVARGELHLTGLLMVAPLLTGTNQVEVLGRAKFRTKKELSKLVRRLSPLPVVADRIEPLATSLPSAPRSPTWAEFMESLAPPVRDLKPGERPSEWLVGAVEQQSTEQALANETNTVPVVAVANETSPATARELVTVANEASPAFGGSQDAGELEGAEPLLYQMQFTTTEEHAELVERAKALLSHRETKLSLGELHLHAMRLLVERLEKQRFGAKPAPQRMAAEPSDSDPSDGGTSSPTAGSPPLGTDAPRQRGRHIPAQLRRAVFERDAARCTFVDERGLRCRETHQLELHHRRPFARNGGHEVENLTLRCSAHNALSAEEDFGREHTAGRREGGAHLSRKRAESG